MNFSRPTLWLLACLLGTATWGAQGTAQAADDKPAQRAEQHLAKEEWTLAIEVADSAQTQSPTASRPFLVKALAYEQLGHVEVAAALLDAYDEARGDKRPDSRRAEARDRLHQAAKAAAPPDSPKPILDTELLATRVGEATGSGQCALARATALEVATLEPNQADSYRLVGNAARCADQKRAAVAAYRRYQALGGTDSRVEMLLSNLSSALASLTVTVVGVPEDAEPTLHLELQGERIPAALNDAGGLYFPDLTAAQEMTLHIGGRGIEPAQHPVAGLSPGERRMQELTADWIGVVRVELTRHDPKMASVMLNAPEGALQLTLDEPQTVTAAELSAVVSNEFGSVTAELWPEGDVLRFDPMIWTPSQLTVVGLPADSGVRIFMEGAEGAFVEETYEVPAAGDLDEERGVIVAPPQKFDGLIGGNAGIFITHPVLGSGTAGAALEAGSVNATTYRWDTMSGVDRVQGAWDRWKAADRLYRQNERMPAWLSLGIGIGSAIAAGALWAGAIVQGNEASDLKYRAQELTGGSESTTASDVLQGLQTEHTQAIAAHRGLLAAAIATSSTTLVGVGLSFPLRSRARQRIKSRPRWEMSLALEDATAEGADAAKEEEK